MTKCPHKTARSLTEDRNQLILTRTKALIEKRFRRASKHTFNCATPVLSGSKTLLASANKSKGLTPCYYLRDPLLRKLTRPSFPHVVNV